MAVISTTTLFSGVLAETDHAHVVIVVAVCDRDRCLGHAIDGDV